jgi:E3 ubiquitin-protein ligase RFWD2
MKMKRNFNLISNFNIESKIFPINYMKKSLSQNLPQGHRKAVSYVKFLNSEQIISAGTDGQLKLWDINKQPHCIRSFVGGHINEKNFVGLATNGDYIACGSEDNSLCIYYKVRLKERMKNF